jgi:hypothetical protein
MLRRLRPRLTYANVMSTIAVFCVLGGGAYAAIRIPNNSVGTKQLKKNAVTSPKVKNGSLLASDFKAGVLPDVGGFQRRGLSTSCTGTDKVTGLAATGDVTCAGDPTAPTGPAGGDLAGSYPTPTLAAGAVGPSKLGTLPAARVYSATAQSILTAHTTLIAFPDEEFDNANLHDPAVDNSRLTAPIAGLYELNGALAWDPNATGSRQITLLKNLSAFVATDVTTGNATNSDTSVSFIGQTISSLVRLDAGDSVEMSARQTSGVTLNTVNTANHSAPVLSMTWVGP